MWREASYENKLVWIIIAVVMIAVVATVVWLYQANLVTFGLKQLNAADCPGNQSAIQPRGGNKFSKKCVGPNPDDKYAPDCSKISAISHYETADGYTGTCFRGVAIPTFN